MLVADAFLDLVLGSSCVGCHRPGRPLCRRCTAALPRHGLERASSGSPEGLAPTYVMGDYDDLLKALVIAHKERRVLALARPLGGLLAGAVTAALTAQDVDPAAPVVLVPVPSRRRVVRGRGHDPTLVMTRLAAQALLGAGRPVLVGRLLRLRSGVADQAGLDADQRAANLSGSMAVDGHAVRRLGHRMPQAHLVVCDDVVTTGATLRETRRAMAAVGAEVLAAACVAATRRRHRRELR